MSPFLKLFCTLKRRSETYFENKLSSHFANTSLTVIQLMIRHFVRCVIFCSIPPSLFSVDWSRAGRVYITTTEVICMINCQWTGERASVWSCMVNVSITCLWPKGSGSQCTRKFLGSVPGWNSTWWRMRETITWLKKRKYRPKFDDCTKSATLSLHHFKIITFIAFILQYLPTSSARRNNRWTVWTEIYSQVIFCGMMTSPDLIAFLVIAYGVRQQAVMKTSSLLEVFFIHAIHFLLRLWWPLAMKRNKSTICSSTNWNESPFQVLPYPLNWI